MPSIPPTTATTAAPTITTTTIVVPTGFDEWPSSPQPPTLDALPRLLPTESIRGADDARRFEWASDVQPGFIDYTQMMVTDDVSPLLLVTTNVGQLDFTPEEFRTYVEVAPWGNAYFSKSVPGYVNLTLVDSDGVVTLNGRNMTNDEVLTAAESMRRRPVGDPGWEFTALPTGMSSFHEGWAAGVASRSVSWFAGGDLFAELDIAAGAPSMIDPQLDAEGATIADVNGSRAIAVERPGFDGPPTSLITWSPEPETVVYFGMRAPLGEALRIARSIRAVDVATWEAAAHPPVNPPDGCNSFRC